MNSKRYPLLFAALLSARLQGNRLKYDPSEKMEKSRKFHISSVLVHFIVPSHPIILLPHLYSRCLGPAFSHAGFEKLLAGDTQVFDAADFHHQLHHRHFDCNYGTVDAPWDKWFATDHDGPNEATIRTQERRRGKR